LAIDHDAKRKAHLRAAIIRHLLDNPLAGDTANGIAMCWVPEPGCADALNYIDDVVATMVAAGELVPRPLPDGRTLYVRGPALPG
jgi:hypothetical protein